MRVSESILLFIRYLMSVIVDWMMHPPPTKKKKVYVHVVILRTCEYYLIWQKMQLNLGSWRGELTPIGPTFNQIYLYKRGRGSFEKKEGEAMWPRRQKLEWCATSQRMPGAPRSWKRQRVDYPLGPLEGVPPFWHLDFRLPAPRTVRQ